MRIPAPGGGKNGAGHVDRTGRATLQTVTHSGGETTVAIPLVLRQIQRQRYHPAYTYEDMPFGGIKQSGYRRETGEEGRPTDALIAGVPGSLLDDSGRTRTRRGAPSRRIGWDHTVPAWIRRTHDQPWSAAPRRAIGTTRDRIA